MEYLLECFKTARKEIMYRVAHRDRYLSIHLLVQAILFGLASEMKIAGVEPSSPIPVVLALSLPLSVVFALLYFVEDRILGQLSAYVGTITEAIREQGELKVHFDNWDASPQLRRYAKTALHYRYTANLFAFLLIPGSSIYVFRLKSPPTFFSGYVWLSIQIALYLVVLALATNEYRHRKSTGRKETR